MNLAPVIVIALCAFLVGTVQAADQTLLGATFQVKNPKTPDKRTVQVHATEKASANTIVGNPVTSGATLTLRANGTTPSEQVFPLPQGSNAKGKPFWSGDPIKGFTYADAKGEQGAVSKVQLKKSKKGVFSLRAQASGKLQPLNVAPPNVGTDACAYLEIGGGDAYSVKFGAGDGTIVNKLAKEYLHKKVTVEGSCAPTCTPGAPGCGWSAGDMYTGGQTAWGDVATTLGTLLQANFNTVYPTGFAVGEINLLRFSDAPALFSYLPAIGPANVLTATVLNPLSTSAGELGGEVAALALNLHFSSTLGNAVDLANLRICNTSLAAVNGQTVGQFALVANHILGGGSASITPSSASAVARQINNGFIAGTPSTFAQAFLINGACP